MLIGIMILLVGGFIFLGSGKSSSAGNTGSAVINKGEAQKINLGTKNYNYYPDTIKVKAGQPVELTLDESVYGCLRSFTIKDLGIQEYSRSPEEKIEFTPTQKGTFAFSCSMGMGYGKLIVE